MYLQRFERNVSRIWAQDARVDHPPELLPLLMVCVEGRIRRCGRGPLPLRLKSALNGSRHSVVIWSGSSSLCIGSSRLHVFSLSRIHAPLVTSYAGIEVRQ